MLAYWFVVQNILLYVTVRNKERQSATARYGLGANINAIIRKRL